MSYFDEILDRRGLETCPLPLWKLKITDDEYEQLRAILEKRTHLIGNNGVFFGYSRECALFFAEFWRREYREGTHAKADVYKALRSTIFSRDFTPEFYEAAAKGAKNLGIEIYEGKRRETLDSLLYQGGLPMRLVTDGDRTGLWNNFTRGLVNRHIDFDSLNLGPIATETNSIRLFCEQLSDAIEAEQYMLMPFFCKDYNNPWFVYLLNLAKQERRRRMQNRPFTLDWEFTLDQNANKLHVKYVVKGVQHLPKAFIEEQHLEEKFRFLTTQVRVNGKAVDTFDYFKFHYKGAVISEHPYKDGDNVAFYINDELEPHLSDELDMSVPHLLYRNDKGAFLLGNRLGKVESAIVFPNFWKLDNNDIPTMTYTWNDVEYKLALIPETYIDPIRLHSDDEELELSSNAKLIWTDFKGVPVGNQDVSEQLYDANNLLYFTCYDGDEEVRKLRAKSMEYKGALHGDWQSTAPYGIISARAKDANGRFVTPVKFINIGTRDDLVITNISESEDTCVIKVKWSHGKVICKNGTRKANDCWEVKKENCKNYKIPFTLIPEDNSYNQFVIHVRAPFKEFAILNWEEEQQPLKSGSWVPYVYVDKCQYHLVGNCIKQYTYGNVVRELKEIDGRLWIVEKGRLLKSIPFEGSLTTLFDSRETLRVMLDKISENMLNTAVNIEFVTTKGKTLSFAVKDSPYRMNTEGNRISISNQSYRGELKLLKLDEPKREPCIIKYDDTENCYIVPADVYSWGKMIVVGSTEGIICPRLIDMTQELTDENRITIREEAINNIRQEIAVSTLGDKFWTRALDWYWCINNNAISAGSLLEFKCISEDPISLLSLTFQLFARCRDEEAKETLANQLMTFSNDLAFQWYWLKPYIHQVMMSLQQKIGSLENNGVRDIFYRWAMQQENPMQYLTDMNIEENIITCLTSKMQEYQQWMLNLAVTSLLDRYEDNIDDVTRDVARDIVNKNNDFCYIDDREEYCVETNQDCSWRISQFFDNYANQAWHTESDRWLWTRINVAAAHLRGEIDLFKLSDDVSDGVRRSLIFCSKSCNHKFIIELNNKLAKR